MSRVACSLSCVLMVLLMAASGDGWAQQRERGQQQPARQQQPQTGDLSDSVRRIERRTGGQVLSAERVPYDGRNISRIKVMDDRGRVRVYMDDPAQRRGERPRVSRRDDE